jgi:hypothetical protein
MSWETAKKTLLNSMGALGGFLIGSWIGHSEKVRSMFQRFARGFSGKTGTKGEQENPAAGEGKTRPLKDLKEHFQRKEGFRR